MKRIHTRSRRQRASRAIFFILVLTLCATLAVQFHAVSRTLAQVPPSDNGPGLAQTAAEFGMHLMRRELAQVKIPPGTPSNMVMSRLYDQLRARLNGSRYMGNETVGMTGDVICIPGNASHGLKVDSACCSTFNITITSWGSDIVVKSTGNYGAREPVTRSITMDFTSQLTPTSVFEYAIASKGQIVLTQGTISGAIGTNASVAGIISSSPASGAITMSGGAVGGELNILSGAGADVTGGSVGGASDAEIIRSKHVHVAPDPGFPAVDTSVFAAYATNTYVPGAALQQNIVIPPYTNPKFNSGDVVQGIMYVRSPNVVQFLGNFSLQGFIVFENAGSSGVNSLEFRGKVSQSALPTGRAFDTLRTIGGVSILAPSTAVSVSGNGDSNLNESVIAGSFSWSGEGNLNIDSGTLMTLNDGANSAVFSGSKSVVFVSTGQKNQPSAGLSYSYCFVPKASTYQQLQP